MEQSSEITPTVSSYQELKRPATVAPIWHTLLLIAVLVVFSFAGAKSEHKLASEHGRILQYLVTIVWEWLLVAYVWWGVKQRGTSIRDLIGGRWKSVEDGLVDVAIATAFWIVAALVLVGMAYALGLTAPDKLRHAREQLDFLVPRSTRETIIWVALSCTAGFCEEVIFRGYFQKQFAALARNVWAGVAVQAVLFGAAHGYEGRQRMLMIAVYGLMFGLLAQWRKSLRTGMMAHAWHDALSGIASRFVPR